MPFTPWDEARAIKEYPYIDQEGRQYKKIPVHAPGVRRGETGELWRGKSPSLGKHWQYPPSKLDEMDVKGEIYWSSTENPRRKVYLDKNPGIPLQDIWMDAGNFVDKSSPAQGFLDLHDPIDDFVLLPT